MAIEITPQLPVVLCGSFCTICVNHWQQNNGKKFKTAFHEYAILLFRAQPLTDEEHIAFSARFGPVFTATNYHWKTEARRVHAKMADISNIGNDGAILPADDERRFHSRANELWHTDNTFKFIAGAMFTASRTRSARARRQNSPICVPLTTHSQKKRKSRLRPRR